MRSSCLALIALLAVIPLHAESTNESNLQYLQKANAGTSSATSASGGMPLPTQDKEATTPPKDALIPLRSKRDDPQTESAPQKQQKPQVPVQVEWVDKEGKPLPKTEAEKEIQDLKQRIRRIEAILKKNGLMPISDTNTPQ